MSEENISQNEINKKLKPNEGARNDFDEEKISNNQSKERDIVELDKKLMRLQHSTQTAFKFFTPLHDKMRQNFKWYYKWHINYWVTSTLHLLFFVIGAIFLLLAVYNSYRLATVVGWRSPNSVFGSSGSTNQTNSVFKSIDNDDYTYWVNDVGNKQWVIYDMGSSSYIDSVRVYRSYGERQTVNILASNNTAHWYVTKKEWQMAQPGWNETDIEPIEGRYVKIEIDNNLAAMPYWHEVQMHIGSNPEEAITEIIKTIAFWKKGVDSEYVSSKILITNPKPTETSETIESEKINIKSIYGGIDLATSDNPDNFHLTSNTKVKLFVRPKKEIAKAKSQFIYRQDYEEYRLLPAEGVLENLDKKINFLPAVLIANAQEINDEKKETRDIAGQKEKELIVLQEVDLKENRKGILEADFKVLQKAGEYELRTILTYSDGEVSTLRNFTLVNPNGYVFIKNNRGEEVRIAGAKITLFKFDNDSNKYEPWQASEFGQTNPKITGTDGQYSFLVPGGVYYLSVEADGYKHYQSEQIQITSGGSLYMPVRLERSRYVWGQVAIGFFVFTIIFSMIKITIKSSRRKKQQKRMKGDE